MSKEKTQKEIVQKDVENYAALDALKVSEGGQLILKSLKKDIVGSIDAIAAKNKDATHAELVSLCVKLTERIVLYRMINRSTKNKNLAVKELSELLEEDEE